MSRCSRELALAAIRKLARYVPSLAPRIDRADEVEPYLEVVVRFNPETVFDAFGKLKLSSTFPSVESVHVALSESASATSALDKAALEILAHLTMDRPLGEWAQKVFDRLGGKQGWNDVPKTDGSFRFIRGVVSAQAKAIGMPPNEPVVEREAVGSSADTPGTTRGDLDREYEVAS